MFIEENEIGTSAAAQAGSKLNLNNFLDIEIFLGEDNGADLEEDEEDDGVVEEEIDEILATEENKDDRVTSQLRQSHNADRGMEGFEGIVGIGAGGKKGQQVVQHPKTAGLNKVKPDTNKPKKEQAQVAPISLGIFGSGMQKK